MLKNGIKSGDLLVTEVLIINKPACVPHADRVDFRTDMVVWMLSDAIKKTL